MQDHSDNTQGPNSIPEARPPSIEQMEQEADDHRARFIASLNTFRLRAASEATGYVKRTRKAALATLAARIRRHPFGAAALGAGLARPVLRLFAAMPGSLILTGVGAAALARSAGRDDPGDANGSQPTHDVSSKGSASAPAVPPGRERRVQAVEPISSPHAGAAHAGPSQRVGTRRSGTLARVRNDALVRAALNRPVLLGTATIALGALVAVASTAGGAKRRPTPRHRGEGADASGSVDADGPVRAAAPDRAPSESLVAARPDASAAGPAGSQPQQSLEEEAGAAAGTSPPPSAESGNDGKPEPAAARPKAAAQESAKAGTSPRTDASTKKAGTRNGGKRKRATSGTSRSKSSSPP